MNDDLRPADRAALDLLRSARRPASDVARARARRAFLETPATPARRRPWIHAAVALAAMLVLWIGMRPDVSWTLTHVDGPPVASRGGVPLDLALGRDFVAGRVVTGPETELEIERGDLHLRIRSGSDARIPSAPGRWFGRTRTIDVERGEVYGSSADRGPGFDLVLRTPEATAHLTGTTFAVFRTDDATCFCLYRGGLDVTPRGGSSFALPVGHRVFVYDDGRTPRIEPLDDGETMKLRMIDDAASQP